MSGGRNCEIGITATEDNLDSMMDMRFGRCQWFLVYDETGDVKAIKNDGQRAGGGAGVAAANLMADNEVEVLITGNVGPNAHQVLASAGIKVYKGSSQPCRELIEKALSGELPELTSPSSETGGRRK